MEVRQSARSLLLETHPLSCGRPLNRLSSQKLSVTLREAGVFLDLSVPETPPGPLSGLPSARVQEDVGRDTLPRA